MHSRSIAFAPQGDSEVSVVTRLVTRMGMLQHRWVRVAADLTNKDPANSNRHSKWGPDSSSVSARGPDGR
jgi:hypothetical protein